MAEEKKSEVTGLLEVVEDLEKFESMLHIYKLTKGGIEKIIQDGIELLAILNSNSGMADLEYRSIQLYYGVVSAFCDKMELMHYYQLFKIKNEYRTSVPRLWS